MRKAIYLMNGAGLTGNDPGQGALSLPAPPAGRASRTGPKHIQGLVGEGPGKQVPKGMKNPVCLRPRFTVRAEQSHQDNSLVTTGR